MVNSFKIVKKLSKLVRLQGHPQRVAKVNKLWKSQFSNKFSFLNCSWKKSSDKLLPPLHPDLSEMFWGFPQRLRLQRWLSENQAPGAQKAGAGGCFRALNAPREPIFWVRTHFSSQLRTNSVLTQTRIFRRVKDQLWLFWGPFWAPRASQRWRRNLWGKPQNISERSGWSGGVICRYFSSRNSWEN